LVALLLLALCASAQAYSVAPGWVAGDYAAGFPISAAGWGPIGLVFDADANLLVTDPEAGALYSIPAGGGTAAAHVVRSGYGANTGLAFDTAGRLYMARPQARDIIEIDPATGARLRTLARGLACPVALATDPLSGDLFESNAGCGGGAITRIFRSDGSKQTYTSGQDGDGLAFAPDGTLYAASGERILRIDGTGTPSPAISVVARVPGADGIVYRPATAGENAFLLVNRRDGEIDRLELDGRTTPVLTGGTRGDLVTVGPDHCMYATQRDRILKLGPAQGACVFAAPVQPGVGLVGGASGGASTARAARHVVDLAVGARAPRSLALAARLRLTIVGRNRSPQRAHSVTLVATLPRHARLLAVRHRASLRCRSRGRRLTCHRASLRGRGALRLGLVIRPRSAGVYRSAMRIRSRDLDPAPGNNRAHTRTRVRRLRH
jgi:hypothetical protein